MNRSHISPCALGIGALGAALIVALLRSATFAFAFDRTAGYCSPGVLSTLLYIALALALAGCVGGAVIAVAMARRQDEDVTFTPEKRSPAVKLSSLLIALACVAAAVYSVYCWAQGASALMLVYALAALLAIPYFVPAKPIATFAWFGLGVLAACVLSAAIEYFDVSVAMNSPVKLMQQFAALSIAIYFLSELYALTGKMQPRRTLLFGSIAVVLGVSNGITNIVAAMIGGILTPDYLVRSLVLLTLGLYVAARLMTARRIPSAQNQQSEEA